MAAQAQDVMSKWPEIKGDLKKTWSKLSEGDLDKTKGDLKAISTLIQQQYGEPKDKSADKLAKIFKRFETASNSTQDRQKKPFKK